MKGKNKMTENIYKKITKDIEIFLKSKERKKFAKESAERAHKISEKLAESMRYEWYDRK